MSITWNSTRHLSLLLVLPSLMGILGGGFDLPLRVMGLDIFPRVKVNVGRLKAPDGTTQGLIGVEASGTVRFR